MASDSSDTPTPPMAKPRRRRWLLIAVLVIAALLLAYLALRPAAKEAAPEASSAVAAPLTMQLLPTELYHVARGLLRDSVQVTGSLMPARELSIPAEVSGRIDAVNVRIGDQVRSGDALVTIDIDTLRNRLEQQRATAAATAAQLSLAQAQLQRANDLVKRGVSALSALETETANVAQLEATHAALQRQVETAEADLAKARITAPFDAVVSARAVDPGTYVTLGTELMGLVDITALDLQGGVPVVNAPRLRTGQVVELTVDGLPDHQFQGKIDRIAPLAVAGTRVLPVFARIENKDGLLKGGMFAAGTLVLEQSENGIGIPADALRADETGNYVLKIVEGRALRQEVTPGRSWNRGRTIEISAGLTEGDVIVALDLERLQDGMAVALVEQ